MKQSPLFNICLFVILFISNQYLAVASPFLLNEKLPQNKEIEFKRGDILIKANHNLLPGSSFVNGGSTFGHAAIVLEGGKDTSVVNLLKKTTIFESHSRDVSPENQIRQIKAYKESSSIDSVCLTFSEKYIGGRYRLRANLTEEQIESIISFITKQDDATSSYRATKIYESGNNSQEDKHWYCSLIIWQAFYDVLGIDIDANKGLVVYPNDIINSPLFLEDGSILKF